MGSEMCIRDRGELVFLDDMTLEQLSEALQISIRIVHGAADIVAAAMGDGQEIH